MTVHDALGRMKQYDCIPPAKRAARVRICGASPHYLPMYLPPAHATPQQQSGYPPPPNGYPHTTAYVPPPYGSAPPHPPPPSQWTPEAWQHFHPQSFVQASAPVQDSQQYAANSGRQEIQPQSAPESRAPPDNAPHPVSTQHAEEQPQPSPPAPVEAASQPATRASRDETHAPPPQPAAQSLDYSKVSDNIPLDHRCTTNLRLAPLVYY